MPGKTPQKGSEKKRKGKSIKERRKEKREKQQREATSTGAVQQ